MSQTLRRALFFALACSLCLASRTGAIASPENTLEIVVGNGPHAGTYKPPAASVICLHAKKQKRYTAAWKDFDAHDEKGIAEAGINVSNPFDAGTKHGEVRIAFGDPDKQLTVYGIARASLTWIKKGKGAEITLEGKTKEGILLRVVAKCSDVEEM